MSKRKATMREALDRIITEVRGVEKECLALSQDDSVECNVGESRTWIAVAKMLGRIAERAVNQEPLS